MHMRLLVAVAGLAAGCHDPSPPATPDAPHVATGAIQMTDASLMFPLSTSYLSASDSGARGVLLPKTLYTTFGPITGSSGSPAPGGTGSADYGSLHVVAMRLDPCFASLAPDPQGANCTAQLRLVFQEVTGTPPTAFDSALHVFYRLDRAELLDLVSSIAELRAQSIDGRLGGLAPHPLMVRDGMSGAFAVGVRALILAHAGEQNLTRLTQFSSSNDGFDWAFSGADVSDAASATLTAMQIPSLAGSATQQSFFRDFGTPPNPSITPETTSADDPEPLATQGVTQTQAQAAFTGLVRVDHPAHESPNTIDCASCHLASQISQQIAKPMFGLDEATDADAYQADGTYVLASELTEMVPTDRELSDFHAFSYNEDRAEINQRTVNETAANVVYLNQALGL
nr:hypothetical protein [Kofleriaceae bacterium]